MSVFRTQSFHYLTRSWSSHRLTFQFFFGKSGLLEGPSFRPRFSNEHHCCMIRSAAKTQSQIDPPKRRAEASHTSKQQGKKKKSQSPSLFCTFNFSSGALSCVFWENQFHVCERLLHFTMLSISFLVPALGLQQTCCFNAHCILKWSKYCLCFGVLCSHLPLISHVCALAVWVALHSLMNLLVWKDVGEVEPYGPRLTWPFLWCCCFFSLVFSLSLLSLACFPLTRQFCNFVG